jgi:hypothetical protein
LELLIFEAQLMPLVGLLKFVSFTRSLVIKFWATVPAVNGLACRLKTQPLLEALESNFKKPVSVSALRLNTAVIVWLYEGASNPIACTNDSK